VVITASPCVSPVRTRRNTPTAVQRSSAQDGSGADGVGGASSTKAMTKARTRTGSLLQRPTKFVSRSARLHQAKLAKARAAGRTARIRPAQRQATNIRRSPKLGGGSSGVVARKTRVKVAASLSGGAHAGFQGRPRQVCCECGCNAMNMFCVAVVGM